MVRGARIRAMVALLAGAALTSAGGVVVAARAVSSPDLPPISAQRLVASVVRAARQDPPVSGHVATRVDLGLPTLPDEGPQAATGPAAVLDSINGDHAWRLWRSRDGFRVNELLPFGERSVAVSRTDAWAWDSTRYTAYHLVPPAGMGTSPGAGWGPPPLGPGPGGPGLASGSRLATLDPLTLANRALSAITPSTAVSVGRAARVAGRDAYLLVLEPRTPGTLIGRIEIAIDAQHRVALSGAIFGRGAGKAAVSAAFTSVSFDPVDRSVYRFAPPPGARVVRPNPDAHGQPGDRGDGVYPPGAFRPGLVRTFGRDWAAIVAVRTPPLPPDLGRDAGLDLRSFLPYSGPLLSVRLVERAGHDWIVYGAVPQRALAEVQRDLP